MPADPDLGWRRRLAVDIRPLGPGTVAGGEPSLGTIWLQEGRQPLDVDAGSVLEGAAAVAGSETVGGAVTPEDTIQIILP